MSETPAFIASASEGGPTFVAIVDYENPTVLLAVAGDWAFVPSAWKAVGDEDPALAEHRWLCTHRRKLPGSAPAPTSVHGG